jgi:CRP-like cAMP-binding protein
MRDIVVREGEDVKGIYIVRSGELDVMVSINMAKRDTLQ